MSESGHEAETPTSPARVVVVDDNDMVRELLAMIIDKQPGLEMVGQARDGDEGVDTVRQLRPDLVVLDLSMPNRDGLEALPEIRELVPEAVIVIFSGFIGDGVEERVTELGANALIAKGLPALDLGGRLHDLAHRNGHASPAPDEPGPEAG